MKPLAIAILAALTLSAFDQSEMDVNKALDLLPPPVIVTATYMTVGGDALTAVRDGRGYFHEFDNKALHCSCAVGDTLRR